MADANVKVEVLDVTAMVEREGFYCKECKHRHAGKTLNYICVGCPCDFVPDFDAIAKRGGANQVGRE